MTPQGQANGRAPVLSRHRQLLAECVVNAATVLPGSQARMMSSSAAAFGKRDRFFALVCGRRSQARRRMAKAKKGEEDREKARAGNPSMDQQMIPPVIDHNKSSASIHDLHPTGTSAHGSETSNGKDLSLSATFTAINHSLQVQNPTASLNAKPLRSTGSSAHTSESSNGEELRLSEKFTSINPPPQSASIATKHIHPTDSSTHVLEPSHRKDLKLSTGFTAVNHSARLTSSSIAAKPVRSGIQSASRSPTRITKAQTTSSPSCWPFSTRPSLAHPRLCDPYIPVSSSNSADPNNLGLNTGPSGTSARLAKLKEAPRYPPAQLARAKEAARTSQSPASRPAEQEEAAKTTQYPPAGPAEPMETAETPVRSAERDEPAKIIQSAPVRSAEPTEAAKTDQGVPAGPAELMEDAETPARSAERDEPTKIIQSAPARSAEPTEPAKTMQSTPVHPAEPEESAKPFQNSLDRPGESTEAAKLDYGVPACSAEREESVKTMQSTPAHPAEPEVSAKPFQNYLDRPTESDEAAKPSQNSLDRLTESDEVAKPSQTPLDRLSESDEAAKTGSTPQHSVMRDIYARPAESVEAAGRSQESQSSNTQHVSAESEEAREKSQSRQSSTTQHVFARPTLTNEATLRVPQQSNTPLEEPAHPGDSAEAAKTYQCHFQMVSAQHVASRLADAKESAETSQSTDSQDVHADINEVAKISHSSSALVSTQDVPARPADSKEAAKNPQTSYELSNTQYGPAREQSRDPSLAFVQQSSELVQYERKRADMQNSPSINDRQTCSGTSLVQTPVPSPPQMSSSTPRLDRPFELLPQPLDARQTLSPSPCPQEPQFNSQSNPTEDTLIADTPMQCSSPVPSQVQVSLSCDIHSSTLRLDRRPEELPEPSESRQISNPPYCAQETSQETQSDLEGNNIKDTAMAGTPMQHSSPVASQEPLSSDIDSSTPHFDRRLQSDPQPREPRATPSLLPCPHEPRSTVQSDFAEDITMTGTSTACAISQKRKVDTPELGVFKRRKREDSEKRNTKGKLKKAETAKYNLGKDIWLRILEYCPPLFLEKARLISKNFKNMVDNLDSIYINNRKENFGHDMPPPPPGMTERHYMNLLGGKGCMNRNCGDRLATRTYWSWMQRWCHRCWAMTLEREDRIIKGRHSHRYAPDVLESMLECIPVGMHDSFKKPHDYVSESADHAPRNTPRLYKYHLLEDVDKIMRDYNAVNLPPFREDPRHTASEKAAAFHAYHFSYAARLSVKRAEFFAERKAANKAHMQLVQQIEAGIRTRRNRNRKPHDANRSARYELFVRRAAEDLPEIDGNFVVSTKAFKAATRIFRDGGSERGWLALKPKIVMEHHEHQKNQTSEPRNAPPDHRDVITKGDINLFVPSSIGADTSRSSLLDAPVFSSQSGESREGCGSPRPERDVSDTINPHNAFNFLPFTFNGPPLDPTSFVSSPFPPVHQHIHIYNQTFHITNNLPACATDPRFGFPYYPYSGFSASSDLPPSSSQNGQ